MMPAPVALGLVESLPVESAIYADHAMRPISLLVAARQVEITHELIRVVLRALGVTKARLPPPLTLLAQSEPAPNIRSSDPLAWSAAMGARIVRVS